MKYSPLLEELFLWLRGRLSMTREEKKWSLLVLVIIWIGLLGRYAYLKNQEITDLTPAQVEELMLP